MQNIIWVFFVCAATTFPANIFKAFRTTVPFAIFLLYLSLMFSNFSIMEIEDDLWFSESKQNRSERAGEKKIRAVHKKIHLIKKFKGKPRTLCKNIKLNKNFHIE